MKKKKLSVKDMDKIKGGAIRIDIMIDGGVNNNNDQQSSGSGGTSSGGSSW